MTYIEGTEEEVADILNLVYDIQISITDGDLDFDEDVEDDLDDEFDSYMDDEDDEDEDDEFDFYS